MAHAIVQTLYETINWYDFNLMLKFVRFIDFICILATGHDLYDINNLSKSGKGGGSCIAAAFLREFVPKTTPWVHIDMAGMMSDCSDQSYTGNKGMSGRPTRTLYEFIVRESQQ